MLTLEPPYLHCQHMGGKLPPRDQYIHVEGKQTVKETILKSAEV